MIFRKAEGIEVEGQGLPETCLPYSGQQESIHFSLTIIMQCVFFYYHFHKTGLLCLYFCSQVHVKSQLVFYRLW